MVHTHAANRRRQWLLPSSLEKQPQTDATTLRCGGCFVVGACFAKGTLVHTKEGLKPIEQIQVGDWVLSKPENGGEQAYKRVLKTFEYPPERIVNLNYILPGQDRTPGQSIHLRRISVTRNHPFWTKEQGWTAVSELQYFGSTLFFKAPVYNLEVEDFHTYYVGEHGIWVHNASGTNAP